MSRAQGRLEPVPWPMNDSIDRRCIRAVPLDRLLHREVLFAWLWSIGQKVFFNDPFVIVTSRGVPMLLRSKVCACICSEGCIEYVGQAVEAVGAVAKEVLSG